MNSADDIPRLTPEQAEAQRQQAIQLRSDNPITQAKIREYHSLVGRIVEGFDPQKLQIENPIFPETLFRACGFMDFFFGLVQDTPELQLESKWIDIAGSATSEVNIIDSAGKVLFVVPPLYDTSYLKIGNYRRDDMLAEITQNFTNKSGHQATEYLGEALTAKLTNIVSDTSAQAEKHRQQLEKMYAFYGRRPKTADGQSAPSAAPSASKIDDDFEID